MALKPYISGEGDEVLFQLRQPTYREEGTRSHATANGRRPGSKRRKTRRKRGFGFGKRNND